MDIFNVSEEVVKVRIDRANSCHPFGGCISKASEGQEKKKGTGCPFSGVTRGFQEFFGGVLK